MPWIIDRLHAEHANLERLVRLLDRQPPLAPDAGAPHVGLLVDALFYLTRFPDVTHHPLEDRIVERLRVVDALGGEMAAEIEAQHAVLARQGLELLRDLESALREEGTPPELVGIGTRLYAERLRHNIAVEELVLFPRAVHSLGDDDWRAIESALPHVRPDPLFQTPAEARFEELRKVIAAEAADARSLRAAGEP
jgi:hemerythrin-like domain-containing protein